MKAPAVSRIVASRARDAARLEDLPNVGPAVAADLRAIGISRPEQLAGRDPYALYEALNRRTGARHDPCMLDTFIAAVRFVEGAPAQPWWAYTAERKRTLAAHAKAPARTPAARRAHWPGASLNLLWALEGALTGRGWQEVARTERTRLLLELDDNRRGTRHR